MKRLWMTRFYFLFGLPLNREVGVRWTAKGGKEVKIDLLIPRIKDD